MRLTVSDTGPGIPAADRHHIFEPFFTTKEVGERTGLGLATVDGIVKQSGGSIEFAPETSGATFRIYLPRAAAELSAAAPPATESTLPPGGERVLVVEDDPAVGGLVNEALLGLGYSVT